MGNGLEIHPASWRITRLTVASESPPMKMGTPLSNLLVGVANHSGVPIDSFGDSASAINLRTT